MKTLFITQGGGIILDPCAGRGHIVDSVNKFFNSYNICKGSDIHNHIIRFPIIDFLSDEYQNFTGYNNISTIITNSPFKHMNEFIIKSLSLTKDKVIILGRIQVLESKVRYDEIYSKFPPTRVYVYVDRIVCSKSGFFDDDKNRNSMCYGWFVWDKHDNSKITELKWLKSLNGSKIPLFDIK